MSEASKKPRSLAGRVLAAMPTLQDPNFYQTLVFVADHGPEGALGFILNRPLDKKLGDVARGPVLTPELSAIPVQAGGPVQPDRLVLALFRQGSGPARIACRLNLPLEQLEAHLSESKAWVRAFAGYAGWGEGQLDREIKDGAWKICRPDPTLFTLRFARGLWPFYISGDNRWKALLPHLPPESERN